MMLQGRMNTCFLKIIREQILTNKKQILQKNYLFQWAQKQNKKQIKAGGMTENFALFKMAKKTVTPPALNVFQTL